MSSAVWADFVLLFCFLFWKNHHSWIHFHQFLSNFLHNVTNLHSVSSCLCLINFMNLTSVVCNYHKLGQKKWQWELSDAIFPNRSYSAHCQSWQEPQHACSISPTEGHLQPTAGTIRCSNRSHCYWWYTSGGAIICSLSAAGHVWNTLSPLLC